MRRKLATLALALLLVTAGCSGLADRDGSDEQTPTEQPSAQTITGTETVGVGQTPTSRPTDTPIPPAAERVSTDEYDFRTNVSSVYARIESITDLTGGRVYVAVERPPVPTGGPTTGFERRMGFTYRNLTVPNVTGSANDQGSVRLALYGSPDSTQIEQTLAHEFVHTIQAHGWNLRSLPRAVTEGVAVYVTDAYTQRHLPNESATLPEYRARVFDDSVGLGYRLFLADYYFGHEYVETRIDDPTQIDRVLNDPPETDEQLLHPETRHDERPKNLTVHLSEGDGPLYLTQGPTKGELFVRTLLLDGFDRSRAKTVSTGWGNDRVVKVGNRSAAGYVWITRWDTAADATEFERALRTYLTETDRFGSGNRTYTVHRVGTDTVFLELGVDRLPGNVSVAGGETVTVRTGST